MDGLVAEARAPRPPWLDAGRADAICGALGEMLDPLSALVRRGELASPAREHLEMARRNGLRLAKAVVSLRDAARLRAPQRRTVDVGGLTIETAEAFRSAAESAGIAWRVSAASDAVSAVDATLWRAVVLHLASNALCFTRTGEIAMELSRDGDTLRLEVRDAGAGIAPAALADLLDVRRRIDVAGRSGGGLALVDAIASVHGGTVVVSSGVGRGTSVAVRIPASPRAAPVADPVLAGAPAALAVEAFVADALRRRSQEALRTPPLGFSASPEVLVVDDDADARELVRRSLGERWIVRTAGDGAEALRALEERVPHAIVTDVMMPGVDGLVLVRALRASPRTRHVAVVMMSAAADAAARADALDAGADVFLAKPASMRELEGRLEALVLGAPTATMSALVSRIDASPDFLVALGHELRGRIAPVIGALRLVDADDVLRDGHTLATKAARRAAALVDELLEASRLALDHAETPVEERVVSPRTVAAAGPSLSVLVVDDDDDTVAVLAELLEHAGLHALVAHDGPEALVVAAREAPDVAILDVDLPGMDGCALASHLAALPTLSHTRFVAMSSLGDPAARARTAASGFRAHLVKPVPFERILDAVRAA